MIIFKKTYLTTFIWVNDNRIGEIYRSFGNRKISTCPTCGHHKYKQVTKGYNLRIYDRCWRDGILMPLGMGGNSAKGFKRLYQAKAKAEALFG